MTRTVHYRTRESVPQSEFKLLQKTVSKVNSKISWELEGLKLWREHELTEEKQVWGFTKIKNEKEAELVLDSLKELSSKAPNLTWIVYDEGKKENKRIYLKEGKFFSPE